MSKRKRVYDVYLDVSVRLVYGTGSSEQSVGEKGE
jgi:hypothetical protein